MTLALPVEPEVLNDRLLAQQGCFIFPLADEEPFEKNLFETFGLDLPPSKPNGAKAHEDWRLGLQEWEKEREIAHCDLLPRLVPGIYRIFGPRPSKDIPVILKIYLPSEGDDIEEAYRRLEDMNITWASLFPDLTGIARSGFSAIWR